jgi:glutaredoxin-dependent peroxiredoxin
MPLAVGDSAPDFELLADRWGKDAPTYRLSDALAQGGVVLQFFPLPFTGTCETQMCAVRDHIEDYRAAGVTVWGVTGHYPQLIAAWDKEHAFGVPILADYDREVCRTYVGFYEDVLPANLRLTSKRAVLGISRDGIVRFLWVSEIPRVGPDDEVVRTAIDAARG